MHTKYRINCISLLFIAIIIISIKCSSITSTTAFFKTYIPDLKIESYSGYENIDWYQSGLFAQMYYSLWQGKDAPWDDHSVPLIIWLQGGPGGSSQFGCFNEVGPLHITGTDASTFKVIQNSFSWNSYAHIMCVDQPVGVGFSWNKGKIVDNSVLAAKHFVNFLYNFFQYQDLKFGLRKNPLYFAGQSYAGHYIPAIIHQILSNSSSLGFQLKGSMIGDGYTDPQLQINNYDSYLYSAGIVSNSWKSTTNFMMNQAIKRIKNKDFQNAAGYINFIIANDTVAEKYYNGMNVLNYKQYDDGNINDFYSVFLENNKAVFGVPTSVHFVDDYQDMYYAFNADLASTFKQNVQQMLQKGLKTLIYNGQNDFIVSTRGVLKYIESLRWKKIKQWKQQQKKIWKQAGRIVGWTKKYSNLFFAIVRDAGHLVPSDQPYATWHLIDRFLHE